MSSYIVPAFGVLTLPVAASARVATFSIGDEYSVNQVLGYPNQPSSQANLFTGQGAFTSSTFTLAGSVVINAGAYQVLVNIGASAAVFERQNFQATPGTLNATGALTAALILGGIVTSTTAAAVTGTLNTGTVMDAAGTFAVGDAFDWAVINTGAVNAFTVNAATGHTIVGSPTVALSTSGRFRTFKTAANTFVAYRLS
jgi:hypothetical protein